MLVELHEDQVPDLNKPSLGVQVFWSAIGPVLRAQVIEDLRRRTIRPGIGHTPPVVLIEALNSIAWHADFGGPDLLRLVVGQVAGDPKLVGIEAEALREQVPRKGNGVFFEIVTKAEIAHHLEERQVAGRATNLVEIVVLTAGTDTLLHCGRPTI